MLRSTDPMNADDLARLAALRDAIEPPTWKPAFGYVLLAAIAIGLIVAAFGVMLNSFKFAGGAPVLAAVLMLVIGCVSLAVVALRLPEALMRRRDASRSISELSAAIQSPTVDVFNMHVTQAWLVPWADVDIEPPLLLVGDDGTCVSLIYPPESVALRVEREEEFHTLVFTRVTLRLAHTKPPRLLSAVGEGPQFIAADTKATWPDDYEKFFLPSGTDEVGVFSVRELTPAWRELVERSTRA